MAGTLSETRQEILRVIWKIDKFLSLPGPVGSRTKSPRFQFSNATYRLCVYPYGDATNEGAVGLYLFSDDFDDDYSSSDSDDDDCQYTTTSSTVIFTLAVKKADGTFSSRGPYCFKFYKIRGFGASNMLARSDLEENKDEFVPGDALTFSCILRKVPPVEAMDALSANLEKLFLSSAHSDVTVQLQSKDYRAHRTILAAQSDVFAAALEHDTLERESGIIQIKDCDVDSFKEFLRYLYTGRAHVDDGNVFHLFRTADKYLVGELKAICVAYLLENMTVDNVCDTVALADDHRIGDLESRCKDFFNDNAVSIIATSKWIDLLREHSVAANELLKHYSKAKN